MKYKIIVNRTETLCDKVTVDGFDYYVSDDLIYNGSWIISDKSVAPIFLDGGDLRVAMLDLTQWRIVIATNNPNIDIPKVVDEVEIKWLDFNKNYNRYCPLGKEQFLRAFDYNKSKETHPYSEADMFDFGSFMLKCSIDSSTKYLNKNEKELFELWKSQRTITIHAI